MGDLAPILPKVGPLVGKLGSDHDPEVIAAARALRRVLATSGLTFNDLAAALGGPVADPAESERLRWFAELRGLAGRRGYKPAWAIFAFEDRFPGEQAPFPEPPSRMPSREVQRWVRNRAARWAKAKHRAGAA